MSLFILFYVSHPASTGLHLSILDHIEKGEIGTAANIGNFLLNTKPFLK
ncbi:hypothetical protein [Pectinatus haikarae]|nr:hypothetical protein [Pectinatus haikarae]